MKQQKTLRLQGITHGALRQLAQAAVGSATEGPDPIAQRSQTADTCRVVQLLKIHRHNRSLTTPTGVYPVFPVYGITEVQTSTGLC